MPLNILYEYKSKTTYYMLHIKFQDLNEGVSAEVRNLLTKMINSGIEEQRQPIQKRLFPLERILNRVSTNARFNR